MPSLPLFLSQLFNGLATGLLLSLISAGLTIIYGTLGVLNLAHGALFMVGAYAGFMALQWTGSFVLAIVGGMIGALLVGLLMERVIVRYYYQRPPEDQILVTFGIGIVITELVRLIFGGIAKPVPVPSWGEGITRLGFLFYPNYRIQMMIFVAVALLLLYLLLYKTRIGMIVRAGIEDSLMVNMLGINVYRIFLLVFGIGAMTAGFAGIVNAPILAVTPDMGEPFLVMSFVVVVIGGVGSFPGAIIGGIIAGEIISMTSMFSSAYSHVTLFAIMAVLLAVRPQGLFGIEGRE
ncbi:MAG TPA: branched-chain amino acid ABC transporter permease [Gammaproteobacteria bacterium]|nr:branched-chain amino acid ABC transporter permease [Gammaproteobacteria bacterium]